MRHLKDSYRPGFTVSKGYSGRWKYEILGLTFISLFLITGGALISYNPADPSFNSASTVLHVNNLIGYFGAYLSDLLFFILGGAAYLIPLAFALNGLKWIRGREPSFSIKGTGGFILLLIMFPALLDLHFDRLPLSINGYVNASGLIGGFIAHILKKYCATMGAHIIAITGVLIGSILITNISVRDSFLTIRTWVEGLINKGKEKISREEDSTESPIQDKGESPLPQRKVRIKEIKEEKIPVQETLQFDTPEGDYESPPLSLLNDPPPSRVRITKDDLLRNSQILERKLHDFGIEGQIVQVHPGPLITMYEFEPAPSIKLSRIANLSDDLALAMKSGSVRIVAPIPGKSTVGIEVPNTAREGVYLKEILASEEFCSNRFKIPLALGKDISGKPVVADLVRMPHLLVAGATGSGKSIFLNSVIASLLFKNSPSQLKLVLIDPKILELSIYEGIPHLLTPVITRPRDASIILQRLVQEMQNRYKLLAEKGVRNIDGYNRAMEGMEVMPYIVVIVDELADLMMSAQRDVEDSIARLAQMARAAGIHLILATQRPSVDVLTGIIKANFPARISFKVSSRIDSRIILDTTGAENLLDRGDMLFLQPGTFRLARIHGAYVSEEEVRRLVEYVKSTGEPKTEYELEIKEETHPVREEERDEMYEKALEIVLSTGQASISMLQRRLRIGFNRAARLVEMMEEDGYVGPSIAGKPREVLKKRNKE